MSLGQQIKKFLDLKGVSQIEFCSKAGITESRLSNIIHDKHDPRFTLIKKILSAYPDLSPSWLILDEGDPLISSLEVREPLSKYSSDIKSLFEENEKLKEQLEDKKKIIKLLELQLNIDEDKKKDVG